MVSLEECRAEILTYDRMIKDNYNVLSGFLASLKEDISSSVEATLAMMNPAPTVMETVELDENWWSEHGEEMGWIPDGKGFYVYTDPDTGETFAYNPVKHQLRQDGVGTVSCRLYLNGDPSEVTETVTLLKAYYGGNISVGDSSTRPQLIIAPDLTGDEGSTNSKGQKTPGSPAQTAKLTLMSSKFGDSFLKSGGNTNDVKRNICGFSMGGVQALKMVSGQLGDQYVGYYDKVTLLNISPTVLHYNQKELDCMAGLELDIVQNYNNANGTADFMADYFTNQRGGPHLEKLAGIPGVKINFYVSDLTYDTHKELTKSVAFVEGLGADNINIIQYSVPEDQLEKYGSGTSNSSHESGRRILLPRYLAGDLEPID